MYKLNIFVKEKTICMKKVLSGFLLLAAVMPVALFSQYQLEYGGSIGVSNYLGDIGGKANTRKDFIADMKMAKTRYDLAAFIRYRIRRELYLKGELSYIRLEGDDALTTNPARHYRNFNFTNNVIELDATAQWMFYENTDLGASYRFRNALRFYAFAGVGVLYHNPKTVSGGSKVALRPLMTEGQETPYKKFVLAIPAGIGFHYTLKKRHRIGWEINWRTTFTDYIDDIKGNYPDPNSISPEAAAAVFTTNAAEADAYEAGFSKNYDGVNEGKGLDKRGDPTHNDAYITTSISYSYVIRGKSSFYRSRYGSFFRKKGRKVIRRIRSKF